MNHRRTSSVEKHFVSLKIRPSPVAYCRNTYEKLGKFHTHASIRIIIGIYTAISHNLQFLYFQVIRLNLQFYIDSFKMSSSCLAFLVSMLCKSCILRTYGCPPVADPLVHSYLLIKSRIVFPGQHRLTARHNDNAARQFPFPKYTVK